MQTWSAVVILTVNYSARLSDVFYPRGLSLANIRGADLHPLIPKIAGEYILMIKDTTLVTATGFIHNVYWRAGQVGRPAFKNLGALLVVAFIYLIVNTLILLIFRVHKFARSGSLLLLIDFLKGGLISKGFIVPLPAILYILQEFRLFGLFSLRTGTGLTLHQIQVSTWVLLSRWQTKY